MYARELAEEDIQHAAEQFVSDLFRRNATLSEGPVIHEIDDAAIEKIQRDGVPEEGRPLDEVVREMQDSVIGYGYNADHARFMGFVPGPTSAVSWLGEVMAAGYNRHAGSFANYPAGCVAENELLKWFADKAGFPEEAGGIFVSGGSMANMTALAAARDAMLHEDAWSAGVVYVSDQTHSSVAKALHIIGIKREHVRIIPCDEHFRMDVDKLADAIDMDRRSGLVPFVVVATAGSTNTGSVDPLERIGQVCRDKGLWMHVDGAFGASALLTRHRDMLRGIEMADSLSWDAHKWLFQTYSCGMVLVRDRATLLKSFSTHPEYLRDLEGSQLPNPWDMGPELTRPARGLKLWFTVQVMGSRGLSEAIEHGFELARWAEDELRRDPDAQVVSPAQMAMVGFRFAPRGVPAEQLDELNARVSRRMLESNYAGIFTTELNGMKVLRICAIHPRAKEEDVRSTVQMLGRMSREVALEMQGE